MTNRNFLKYTLPILVLLVVSSSSSAQVSTSWGVDVGDSAVYWIDNIQFSETGESNIAVFLGDANRTAIFAVTSKGVSSLNYSLGLMNGSSLLNNQQVAINQIDLGSNSLLLPNGSLPIVLPISAGNQNNYLQYLASSAGVANFVISGLLDDMNITNVDDINVEGIYRSTLFNITASATVSDLNSLNTTLLGDFNSTGDITLGQNQTINELSTDLLVSYNSTDGMLMEFGINAAINTTQVAENGDEFTQILTFNATVIRQSFTPLSETLSTISSEDISSAAEEVSFLMMGIIPAFYLLKRRKN